MTNKEAIEILRGRLNTLADAKNVYRVGSCAYDEADRELEATLKAVRVLENIENGVLIETPDMSDEQALAW